MKHALLMTSLIFSGQVLAQGLIQSKANPNDLILLDNNKKINKIIKRPVSEDWKTADNNISALFQTSKDKNLQVDIFGPNQYDLEEFHTFMNLGVYFKSALERSSHLTEKERDLLEENYMLECLGSEQFDQCATPGTKPDFCQPNKKAIKACLKTKLNTHKFPARLTNLPENSGAGFVNRAWWGRGIEKFAKTKVEMNFSKEDCSATIADLVNFDPLSDENYQGIPCTYVETFRQIATFLTGKTTEEFNNDYATLLNLKSFDEDIVKDLDLLGAQEVRFNGNRGRFGQGQTLESSLTLDSYMVLDIKVNKRLPEGLTFTQTIKQYDVEQAKRAQIQKTLEKFVPLKNGMTGLEIIKTTLKNLDNVEELDIQISKVANKEDIKDDVLEKLFLDQNLKSYSLSEKLTIDNGDIKASATDFVITREIKVSK